MFNLTREEKQVVLFLAFVGLLGIGINFFLKTNARLKGIAIPEEKIARLNINQATYEDLLSSQSLSPKLAAKIIAYRNRRGPFTDLEELKEIEGIGECRYEKLKGIFYVE
jgi:competence ComEA-like helix-hairpin-helix protein